ncbi:MAG: hypothetical protein GQ570_15145 [Helicobacteraceae bacterium]|nr:hypothetical protein [Helicobacteraceae bacterium]
MDKNKDSDLTLIEKAFDKLEPYKEIWLEHELYYRSRHSTKQLKKLEKRGRSKLFISTTRNTVNIVRSIFSNSFFSQGCPIEIININNKGGERERNITKIIKYYYEKKKPRKELNKAFLSALLYNMGIVITYWDDIKKRVATFHVPITDIAFDADARNIDDVEYVAYRFNESMSQIKSKIKSNIYDKATAKELFSEEQLNGSSLRRYEVKEIYKRSGNRWVYKTFCNGKLIRKSKVKKIPFNYGIALESIASIDDAERAEQILVYGESLVNQIKHLNDEINQKRNQKNDIQEEMINPSVMVGDKSQVNPNDLKKGAGKRIRVKGSLSEIKFVPTPNDYPINSDLAFLDKDLGEASGVNSIQNGNTSSSDRRSGEALAIVNSNSTTRIADMIDLINETLFEHWAKDFVRLVMANADDRVIDKITGEVNYFGAKGRRDEFEFELKINFGMTLDKEKRISDLINILLPITQNQNINPKIAERVLKEALSIRFGDAEFLDDMANTNSEEVPPLDENEKRVAKELNMLGSQKV